MGIKLTNIDSITGLKVGDKLVHANSDDYYWATVEKINAKSIVVHIPEFGHNSQHMWFKMESMYGTPTSPMFLNNYGKGSYGKLMCAETAEQIALVEACYEKRNAYQAVEKARKEAMAAERQARINDEIQQALSANVGVKFNPIGMMGKVSYFAANAVNKNGKPCFVVLGVMRKVDQFDWENPGKMVWIGALNYAESSGNEYDPHTMASCSPDCKGDTLEELFQDAIVRVW